VGQAAGMTDGNYYSFFVLVVFDLGALGSFFSFGVSLGVFLGV